MNHYREVGRNCGNCSLPSVGERYAYSTLNSPLGDQLLHTFPIDRAYIRGKHVRTAKHVGLLLSQIIPREIVIEIQGKINFYLRLGIL